MHYYFILTVSKQTLSNDIQSLKKGIDLTKKERDKQPENFVLFVSFTKEKCLLFHATLTDQFTQAILLRLKVRLSTFDGCKTVD